MAVAPFEIVAGPAEVFYAPVGEAFPTITTDPPGGNWLSFGRTEGGVVTAYEQNINLIRVNQVTGPLKAIRVDESLHITFSLAEITAERYAMILNDQTVDLTGNTRAFPLGSGDEVQQKAILVRGPSPHFNGFAQLQLYRCVQVGNPSPEYTREDKSILDVDWQCMEDSSVNTPEGRFGDYLAQDSA